MTTSIGIRCAPSQVNFAIFKRVGRNTEMVALDHIIVPKSLTTPELLKFVRNTLLDIIAEYEVTNACIRITESNAQSTSLDRINLEAVVQELIASSTIQKYYVGQISNISAKLEVDRANFKKYIANEELFEPIGEDWYSFSDVQKESILAGYSALNL